MVASQYELAPNGMLMFAAPPQVARDDERLQDQAHTAIRILAALNTSLTGMPHGPCRTLMIFNQDED